MIRNLFSLLLVSLAFCSCARPKKQEIVWREPASKLKLPLIVLDPGHGGDNSGTKMCIAPYTKEKTLALQLALKVRNLLEQRGYPVRLTRTKDVFIPLNRRVSLAKEFHGSLFVSLHFNHAPNKEAHGIEIFYYDKSRYMAASKKLAQDVLKSVISSTSANSRGAQPGDYHVLRENSMPAILIEGGFFSNAREAKKLCDPKYITTLAYSIAIGIDDYVQSSKKRI